MPFRSAAFRSAHAPGFHVFKPQGVQVVLHSQCYPRTSESQVRGLRSDVVSRLSTVLLL